VGPLVEVKLLKGLGIGAEKVALVDRLQLLQHPARPTQLLIELRSGPDQDHLGTLVVQQRWWIHWTPTQPHQTPPLSRSGGVSFRMLLTVR